jgi:uncharacterized membrane protein YkoI
MIRAFSLLVAVSIAPVALCAQGATAPKPVKVTEDKPGLLKRAKISADSATKLAVAAVPNGRVTKGEIEEEKGKLIYSFDIKVPGKGGIEEIHIDPATGAVVGREHEGGDEKPAPKKKP